MNAASASDAASDIVVETPASKKPRAARKTVAKPADATVHASGVDGEGAASAESSPRVRATRAVTKKAVTEKATKASAATGKAATTRGAKVVKTKAKVVDGADQPQAASASPASPDSSSTSGARVAAPRLVRKPAAVDPPRETKPKPREEAKTLEATPLPRAVEDALAKARAALDELTAPIVPAAPVAAPTAAPVAASIALSKPEPVPDPVDEAPAVILEDEPPAPHGDVLAVSIPPRIVQPIVTELVVEEEKPAPHGDELLSAVPQRKQERVAAPLAIEEEAPAPQGDALLAPAAAAPGAASATAPVASEPTAAIAAKRSDAPSAVAATASGATANADGSGLSILMVASEAVPFAKTGGLADVAAALPVALAQLGHRVTMVIPRYRGVEVAGKPIVSLDVTIGRETHHVDIYEVAGRAGSRTWLVDQPALFDRDGIYGKGGHDHPDNPRRYALLVRAAFEAAIATGFRPDIVHAHDWQGGLAPVYLKTRYAHDPVLGGVPSIFTIHNIAYTGLADPSWLPALDLGWELYRTDGGLEYWHKASFLKAGINFADKITTVSPSYARELLTPEFAFGFEGVLQRRRQDLIGILNGIDADTWNPAADPFIPMPYTADDLSGKLLAKRALLRAYGLPHDEASLRAPLIGMVSRMVDQKGLDMIAQSAAELPHLGARFVVLGTGEPRYEEMWRTLAAHYPDRIAAKVGFDEPLSHLVEAGADLFLMPSHFEPCGLNQMYSLRYGTLPFVRATGGLDDTVDNYHPATGGGNGFKFWEPTGPALINTLRWALTVYQHKDVWRRLQRAAMAADFSWTRSAQQYVALYEEVLQGAGRLAAARARTGAR